MAEDKKPANAEKETWLTHLRTTITNTLKAIADDKDRVLTIQEVSKLIELHEKLSDSQAGSKEFWEMLARLRKDELAPKKAAAPSASPRKTASRRKAS